MSTPGLFVADLDGTLLGGHEPYARIPGSVCERLARLCATGWVWATNTTWHPEDQLRLLADSPLPRQAWPRWLVGELSLRIWDLSGGTPMPVEPYGSTTHREVAEVRARHLLPVLGEILAAVDHRRCRFYGHLAELVLNPPDLVKAQAIAASAGGALTVRAIPSMDRLDLWPACLGKGRGLLALHALAGVGPAATIVAGDGWPDLAMMEREHTTRPLCPSSAPEEVQSAVRNRSGTIGAGTAGLGVIAALDELLEHP